MTRPVFIPPLINYVPSGALEYCLELYRKHPFQLKITLDRKSKTGDYKHDPKNNQHQISVNGSLNRFAFLITYIHEVAHQHTFRLYGKKAKPHGAEWKSTFQRLMLPILHPDVFPEDILKILARHLKNPKASTHSDPLLVEALRVYSTNNEDSLRTLISMIPGENFLFNKKQFIRLEKRRTRVLCEEVQTGKKYLISGIAMVKPD